MAGTKMIHGICGVGGVFDTKEQAINCTQNNIVYRGVVAIIFSLLFIILTTMVMGIL